MTLGEHIRTIRNKQNLTLSELSKKANLSVPYLSDVERSRANPSYNSLCLIAKGLDITVPEVVNVNNVYETQNANRLKELQAKLYDILMIVES